MLKPFASLGKCTADSRRDGQNSQASVIGGGRGKEDQEWQVSGIEFESP